MSKCRLSLLGASLAIDLAGPGPDVLAVAADVHQQEVHAVDVLLGQVVDHADDRATAPANAVASPQSGSPSRQSAHVIVVLVLGRSVVEAGIAQEILGLVRAAAEPVRTVGEFQVVTAGVTEEAVLEVARRIGIARRDIERAGEICLGADLRA